jgi:hypothetical protein
MKNYLCDFAKRRFNKDVEALPEREQRIIRHYNQRLPISHDTNEEFETELKRYFNSPENSARQL